MERRFDLLTPRERQCLALLYRHRKPKQIALDLGLGVNTVYAYLRDAREKLDAPDTTTAAIWLSTRDEALPPQYSGEQTPGVEAGATPPLTPLFVEPASASSRLNDIALDELGTHANDGSFASLVSEILSGNRPDRLSALSRATLILAAIVVIGFALFAFNVAFNALYGLVVLLRG